MKIDRNIPIKRVEVKKAPQEFIDFLDAHRSDANTGVVFVVGDNEYFIEKL